MVSKENQYKAFISAILGKGKFFISMQTAKQIDKRLGTALFKFPDVPGTGTGTLWGFFIFCFVFSGVFQSVSGEIKITDSYFF